MSPKKKWLALVLILLAAFSFRLAVAITLKNDTPEDGKVYAQFARNLLERQVYSHAKAPPYKPSIIRLPGYSIFLAGIYSIFGHWNNTAVRVTQAVLDTLTCGLIALLAWYWEPDEKRKQVAGIGALILAALCPFTTIYVATVLTETWASLFAVLLALLVTRAFLSVRFSRSLWYWGAAGLVGGASVFFRPDSGLFVAAVGLTLVLSLFSNRRIEALSSDARGSHSAIPPEGGTPNDDWLPRLAKVIVQGAVLSIAFALVLVPWTVRNWREFHLFQPLAPTHGEMPGEFVSHGYYMWLRTWVDDRKYTDPLLWELNEAEVDVEELPATAFDSPEEKERVIKLFEEYNDTAVEEPAESQDNSAEASPLPPPVSAADHESSTGSNQTASQAAKPEQPDQEEQSEEPAEHHEPPPEMTPALDAAFGQIARERIARSLRYYVWVPLKRMRTLWFGSHSSIPVYRRAVPLDDLDHTTHQQIWLPLFLVLVWTYTSGLRRWRR